MVVTKIIKSKKKNLIYIDDKFIFALYDKELKKYNIVINETITEDVIKEINEIVLKRGRQYVYHLLAKKDYTYQELNRKLINSGYSDENTLQILNYVKNYNLINDRNYVVKYIEYKKDKHSIKEIIYALKNKGISNDIIKSIIEEMDIDEKKAAFNILRKKVSSKDITNITDSEKYKLYQYMIRRGFSSEIVKQILKQVLYN